MPSLHTVLDRCEASLTGSRSGAQDAIPKFVKFACANGMWLRNPSLNLATGSDFVAVPAAHCLKFCASWPIFEDVTRPRHGALHPVPAPTGPADALSELAASLWQERELLEDLLYALVQQYHLLAAGQTRWLARADAAVAATARAVQEQEVFRAMQVEALLTVLGLPSSASLREIAEAVEEPWPTLLDDHRSALRSLADEIEQATARNRALLIAGERSSREALERAGISAPAEPR